MLVPQLSVERFDVAVLPGTPWLHEEGLHPKTFQSLPYRLGRELRPVVRTYMLRYALRDKEVCQSLYHLVRGDLSLHGDVQAFPRVLVEDVEYPEGSSVMSPCRHEIITPDMVLVLWAESDTRTIVQP